MSQDISANNKRIAKNTLFLYIRMLLTMVVTLYTSRVVLQTLGVDDYGIYNIVGGVIVMLNFISSSLSGACSRFITYALGKGNKDELKSLFSAILFIHLALALLIFIFGETIGLWFVNNKLIIPAERMNAAFWVYQCSVLTAIISVISVPYNSLIIAHEKMSAFAYISIIEVTLKLFVVFTLNLLSYDKLIVYAILILCVQIIIRFIYTKYSAKHFNESKSLPCWQLNRIKEIGFYAVWTMNGNLAFIGYTQGVNILLNMFFGPVVNAARGIAIQVESAVMTFVSNFLTAIKPQIIKSYATGECDYMHKLVIVASKYGFFLMMFITFPLLLLIEPVLHLWLGIVPDHTGTFVKIMLFSGLLTPLSRVLITSIHATGNIKKFQLYEGTSLLMILPIAYFLLKFFHITPEWVMLVYIFVELITQCIRVWIVLPAIHMKIAFYLKAVIMPIIIPFLCFVAPIYFLSPIKDLSFFPIVGYSIIGYLYIGLVIFFLGVNGNERIILKNQVYNIVNKIR